MIRDYLREIRNYNKLKKGKKLKKKNSYFDHQKKPGNFNEALKEVDTITLDNNHKYF